MQCGKFFAPFKAVLIYSTLVIRKKMAGYRIEQHHPVAAFFNVLMVEIFAGQFQVPGKVVGFLFVDVYHEAFAAVST